MARMNYGKRFRNIGAPLPLQTSIHEELKLMFPGYENMTRTQRKRKVMEWKLAHKPTQMYLPGNVGK